MILHSRGNPRFSSLDIYIHDGYNPAFGFFFTPDDSDKLTLTSQKGQVYKSETAKRYLPGASPVVYLREAIDKSTIPSEIKAKLSRLFDYLSSSSNPEPPQETIGKRTEFNLIRLRSVPIGPLGNLPMEIEADPMVEALEALHADLNNQNMA